MTSLVTWDPFRALRRRDDLFEDMFRDFFARGGESDVLEPPVDVAEGPHDITVKVLVPGVEKDKLQITIDEDVLTVRGETHKEEEEKQKNFFRREIRHGAFQRAVQLPAEVDAAKTTAALKNGTLTVTLPKSKQPKAQQIKVAIS